MDFVEGIRVPDLDKPANKLYALPYRDDSDAPLRNVSAPVLGLPAEILLLILTEGISMDTYPMTAPGIPFQVNLSHVCQHLRAVTMSAPYLWTSIQWNVGSIHQDAFYSFIQRSQGRALDFYIIASKPPTCWLQPSLWIVEMGRCRSLTVFSTKFRYANYISNAMSNIFAPLLEKFVFEVLVGEGGGIRSSDSWSKVFRRGAPRLSDVTIIGSSLSSCCPPLDTITSLRIEQNEGTTEQLAYKQFVYIVPFLSSLTDLRIHTQFLELDEFIPGLRSVTFPKLRFLEVCGPPEEHVYGVAATTLLISAPNLHCLTVADMLCKEFRAFIEHSHPRYPTVKLLRLEGGGFDCSVYPFLKAYDAIEHLSFNALYGCIFELLILESKGASPIWPHLKSLTLRTCDLGLLRTVITARIDGKVPLSALRIGREFSLAMPRDDAKWLSQHGVKLEISPDHDLRHQFESS